MFGRAVRLHIVVEWGSRGVSTLGGRLHDPEEADCREVPVVAVSLQYPAKLPDLEDV